MPDLEMVTAGVAAMAVARVTASIWAEGAPAETFGGEGLEAFTNFVEYKRLYPNDPCSEIPLLAPNLGTGRAHLYALLGLGASYFIDVRDPLQDSYEKLAARAENVPA
jgi:hypothetical protein